jgi:hypothetical protein
MQRYTLENIRKVLQNPEYVGWEVQRIYFDIRYRSNAIDVMNEDWDNLILLDACRYDYFDDHNTIPGDLSEIISHGGQSWEFMQGNFVGKQFHDTVYVTANPHTGKLDDDTFHAVEPLYIDIWSEEHETVLPSDVVEAALDAYREYPNKRLIIHFMQPHRPYLGDAAEDLASRHKIGGFNRHLAHSSETPDAPSFSTLIEDGQISVDKARTAYRETLDIVLHQVRILAEQLSVNTVVSADHGEMLGERIIPFTTPKFGHSHEYIRNKTLYQVPWLEIPADERRETHGENPVKFAPGDSETVKNRLRSLGYE